MSETGIPVVIEPTPPSKNASLQNRFCIYTLLSLFCVLAMAGGIRYLNFPHRYDVQDGDEVAYIEGGLAMWEGITPGMRVGPAAPETWIGWLYAGARSTLATLRPEPAIASLPWQIRPYFAIDSVLFDTYQDMSGLHRFYLVIEFITSLAGVYGAFQFGRYYGGIRGGILVGGIVALLPLYIDFAGMTRPYNDAWSFSFLAIYSAAALRGTRRWIQTGLFLGLAVSSHVEMLAIIPLVLWQIWENPDASGTRRALLNTCILSLVIILLIVPWMLFQIVGMLRTVAITRMVTWLAVSNPRLHTFLEIAWIQGLAPFLLLTACAVLLPPFRRSLRRWLLTIFVLLLAASMFAGPFQPLRYHGAVVLAIIALAGITTAQMLLRWPRAAPFLVAAALVLPAVQAVREVVYRRSLWVPEDATAWVEKHVPAGTRVYDEVSLDLRCPLPTAASSDALWAQVTDEQAWRKKFNRGLNRLGIQSGDIPRALSEDNLVQDRGLWRRFFIIGGHLSSPRPRYDLRVFRLSPTFGVLDLPAAFHNGGGVIIWRSSSESPPPDLGQPVMQWLTPAGTGTRIYCSPDVVAKLNS